MDLLAFRLPVEPSIGQIRPFAASKIGTPGCRALVRELLTGALDGGSESTDRECSSLRGQEWDFTSYVVPHRDGGIFDVVEHMMWAIVGVRCR